jgi:hypothetical protein
MAPEQAAGQPVSGAADVFALGALAVYAAVAQPAFGEGPDLAVLCRIRYEEPDLTCCPPELRELVSQCLAKNPVDRPAPAEVVAWCRSSTAGWTEQIAQPWLPPHTRGSWPSTPRQLPLPTRPGWTPRRLPKGCLLVPHITRHVFPCSEWPRRRLVPTGCHRARWQVRAAANRPPADSPRVYRCRNRAGRLVAAGTVAGPPRCKSDGPAAGLTAHRLAQRDLGRAGQPADRESDPLGSGTALFALGPDGHLPVPHAGLLRQARHDQDFGPGGVCPSGHDGELAAAVRAGRPAQAPPGRGEHPGHDMAGPHPQRQCGHRSPDAAVVNASRWGHRCLCTAAGGDRSS